MVKGGLVLMKPVNHSEVHSSSDSFKIVNIIAVSVEKPLFCHSVILLPGKSKFTKNTSWEGTKGNVSLNGTKIGSKKVECDEIV